MALDYISRTLDEGHGDTVRTLNGIVKVCVGSAPKMTFFAMPSRADDGHEVLEVISYVKMAALTPELQKAILKELHLDRPPTAQMGSRTGDDNGE